MTVGKTLGNTPKFESPDANGNHDDEDAFDPLKNAYAKPNHSIILDEITELTDKAIKVVTDKCIFTKDASSLTTEAHTNSGYDGKTQSSTNVDSNDIPSDTHEPPSKTFNKSPLNEKGIVSASTNSKPLEGATEFPTKVGKDVTYGSLDRMNTARDAINGSDDEVQVTCEDLGVNTWQKISILVCAFVVLREFHPIEPYFVKYLETINPDYTRDVVSFEFENT